MSLLKKVEDIEIALGKYSEIFNVLSADLKEASELLHSGINNFRLRTYIRTQFAWIEGTLFGLKQVALTMHEHEPCFSDGELTLLREVTYELSDGGNVRERPKYLDTADNIKFIVKSVTKVFSLPDISFDGEGWQCFKELIRLRNQITHPKDAFSLRIIESDSLVTEGKTDLGGKADIFVKAVDWYRELLVRLVSSMGSAIKKKYVSPMKEK
jgi:hypothetical protein